MDHDVSPHDIDVGGERADHLFSLLNHRYRRYVIQRLRIADCPVLLARLALEIAARQEGTEVEDITPQTADHVRAALHHTHLPKLADAAVLEYDRETGKVALTKRAAALDPLLTAVSESEAAIRE